MLQCSRSADCLRHSSRPNKVGHGSRRPRTRTTAGAAQHQLVVFPVYKRQLRGFQQLCSLRLAHAAERNGARKSSYCSLEAAHGFFQRAHVFFQYLLDALHDLHNPQESKQNKAGTPVIGEPLDTFEAAQLGQSHAATNPKKAPRKHRASSHPKKAPGCASTRRSRTQRARQQRQQMPHGSAPLRRRELHWQALPQQRAQGRAAQRRYRTADATAGAGHNSSLRLGEGAEEGEEAKSKLLCIAASSGRRAGRPPARQWPSLVV